MSEAVFIADDVTKVYHMDAVVVHALRGIDLTLYAGEMAVLLGPSGSGKSTFLNILGGLDRATTGSVMFKDRDLTAYSESQLTRFRRDNVGFVFQFYNLIPSLNAWENVALVTEIARDPMDPTEALAMVGVGTAIGLIAGSFFGWLGVKAAIASMPEGIMELRFSLDPVYTGSLIGVCLLAAVLASILPGRRAANATPTEALAAE